MADRLTAAQFAEFAQRNIRSKATRAAFIDNDAITTQIITDRVTKWGSIKFEVYNKHPDDPGVLRFPVLTLSVDNSKSFFDLGGTIFPNGLSDVESTFIVVILAVGGGNFLNFTGQIKEPEYSDKKELRLVAEHPLTSLTRRKWTRSDRIGGDTGVDFFFNS